MSQEIRSNKNVAIIIPTYNDSRRLTKCLEALSQQSYGVENIQVLVVDNNSTEDLKPLVERYSIAQYFFEGKPGSYNARNTAIKSLTEDISFVGFTDSDCIPEKNWISNAVGQLKGNDNLAIGGKVAVFADRDLADNIDEKPNILELYEMHFAFPQKVYVNSDHFAVTANLFTSRRVVDKVGLFNEQLFSGGDLEYGQKMKKAAVKLIYSEDVTVNHPARNKIENTYKKIKRTVGGNYIQRKEIPNTQRMFSAMGLLKGFLPPITGWKKLLSTDSLTIRDKVRLAWFMLSIKYYTNAYRVAYKLRLVKDFERF